MKIDKKDQIGQILVDQKIITKDQLKAALENQAATPYKLLGAILEEMGVATYKQVQMAYAMQYGLRYVNVNEAEVPKAVLKRIPAKLACKYVILPLEETSKEIVLATHHPRFISRTVLEDLSYFLDKSVDLALSDKEQTIDALCRHYGMGREEFNRYHAPTGLATEYPDLEEEPGFPYSREIAVIGESLVIQQLFTQVRHAARTDANILLLGETGTGKENFANVIHQNSRRKDKPFIKVSCAAIPETLLESEMFGYEKGAFTGAYAQTQGRFELANGGTLFLDEIGDMPIPIQIKLLRVLQDGKFERLGGRQTLKTDVRLIAATNRNLEKEMAEGRFRTDLYYRINVFSFTLPPVRDRKEDIPLLVDYFIKVFNKKHNRDVKFAVPKVIEIFQTYDWPGNVRELANCVERMVLTTTSNIVHAEHIPYKLESTRGQKPASASVSPPPPERPTSLSDGGQGRLTSMPPPAAPSSLKHLTRQHVLEVLQQTRWHRGKAAEILGVHRHTLRRMIEEFGLE